LVGDAFAASIGGGFVAFAVTGSSLSRHGKANECYLVMSLAVLGGWVIAVGVMLSCAFFGFEVLVIDPLTIYFRHRSIIIVLGNVVLVIPVPLLEARKAEVVTLMDVSLGWTRNQCARHTRRRVGHDGGLASRAAGRRVLAVITADGHGSGMAWDCRWCGGLLGRRRIDGNTVEKISCSMWRLGTSK
jgi:hypothetical protein